MDVKPIKPTEVSQNIPNWIIKGANECIKDNYVESNKESRFTQETLLNCCMMFAPEGITTETIFKKHWLDIEHIYRQEGWKVTYDKPAYDEHYKPFFVFKIPQ